MIILVPLPLFFAQSKFTSFNCSRPLAECASAVYGVGGLTAWVTIGILWCFFATFGVVLYPLYESREALWQVARGLVKVCR